MWGDRERENGFYSESVREMEGRQTLCVIQRETERVSLTVCIRAKEWGLREILLRNVGALIVKRILL